MPRRKPIQQVPNFPRNKPSEFKFEKNFEFSYTIPCINKRCNGFMFLTMTKYGVHTPVFDEFECFTCKKTCKLGHHNPNRKKPLPFVNKRKPNGHQHRSR